MPTAAGSVGVDYSFGYFDAHTGQLVPMGDIQRIDIKANKHDVANKPYNGVPKYDYIPDGYSISGSIIRTGPEIHDFQLIRSQRFNAGLSTKAGFLTETVKNPDGSVSRYQYTGFVFFITDIADVSREKTITLSFVGMASDKNFIA